MATSFQGADFAGLNAKTANSYSAVLRCVLVYSTWEAFGDSTGVHARVDHPGIADRLCRAPGLLPYLMGSTQTGASRDVERVATGRSDNVRYVLRALRHVYAHGSWTPNASKVTSQRALTLLHDLADVTLKAIDDEFTRWVESQVATADYTAQAATRRTAPQRTAPRRTAPQRTTPRRTTKVGAT